MINSVASYKESLSRIASEVLDAADELEIRRPPDDSSPASSSGRRIPRRSPRFTSPVGSPVANGSDHSSQDEIAKYKVDIQKLQASEAEIKALSFNYAAMLKEKEEQLSKLLEDNSSLKKSLDEVVGCAAKDESPKLLSTNSNVMKGNMDWSPIRSQRNTSQGNSRSSNHLLRSSTSKQDGFSNGSSHIVSLDVGEQKMEEKYANSQGNSKEHKNLLEEIRSLEMVHASHESEIKQLKSLLDNERESASIAKLKLQEECVLNESSQKELQELKIEKEKTFEEMKMLQKELNEKMSEMKRLQMELSWREMEQEPNGSLNNLDNLKNTISTLEKENVKLKIEKNELEASVELHRKTAAEKTGDNDLRSLNMNSNNLNENTTEDMALSIRKLEECLQETCKERDKALQELARLKQHLLDKELEDSDKMDEDSKNIEELRATTEYQKCHILQLEKALKQELAKKEELENLKNDELHKSQEIIDGLTQKLAKCMSLVDSKNSELQNLQTALGQYYAESEAKERIGGDLAAAREEIVKLSESLKAANQDLDMSRREKEDIAFKYSQVEKMLSDVKRAVQKLEGDNSKLRRTLEQSMTTLNRMSLDSDNHVDRRIVIKLLVTYFQRNHSKEVLDLMVRMLGFSEEDRQRIGSAQGATGKGVVRGVLRLPGRLVGGILGGSSPETSSHAPENQVSP
ncbi:golgin candidate 4-like [Iris pallida]|uniref:Golgin candidate 4-like n=1 Tax=Iris pallida TaxID=29817 RepID=A0AAX6EAK1_IRIPA|nr:golgin candidate 4-like [Iris pallida]